VATGTRRSTTPIPPADFGKGDLANALLAAGFDSSQPALVSWLGVTREVQVGVPARGPKSKIDGWAGSCSRR
jgi:hypothetical protein